MKRVLVIALAAVFMVSLLSINLSAKEIPWNEAKNHIGEEVTICAKIYDQMPLGGGLTLLGLGVSLASGDKKVVGLEITDSVLSKLPKDHYVGKEVCVTGKTHMNPLGGASMKILDPSQIKAK